MKFLKLAAATIVVAGAVDGKENCMDKELYPTIKLRRQCRNKNQADRNNRDTPHRIPGYGFQSTNRLNPMMLAQMIQNQQQNAQDSNTAQSGNSPQQGPFGRPVLTQNGLHGVHGSIAAGNSNSNSNSNNLFNILTQGRPVPILKTAGAGGSSDPCAAAMTETGWCRALFPGKWTYNAATNECESFTYGGCGASANYFHSQANCEQCLKPEDVVTKSGWSRGSNNDKFNRGGNIWGSFMGGDENDFSLPKCDQNMVSTGFGRAMMPFVTFNKDTGECQEAIWGGMGKLTDNAFNSLKDCESACVNNKTPEPTENPASSDSFAGATLEEQMSQLLEESKAISYEDGKCNADNPCVCPKDVGFSISGRKEKRFYWKPKAFGSGGSCGSFIYRGFGGNANSFQTKQSCYERCHPDQIKVNKHFEDKMVDHEPHVDITDVSNGGGDSSYAATAGLPLNPICYQRMAGSSVQFCRAMITVYAYNKHTKQCELAIDGGCDYTTANLFYFKEDCEAKCPSASSLPDPAVKSEAGEADANSSANGVNVRCNKSFRESDDEAYDGVASYGYLVYDQDKGKCRKVYYITEIAEIADDINLFPSFPRCRDACMPDFDKKGK